MKATQHRQREKKRQQGAQLTRWKVADRLLEAHMLEHPPRKRDERGRFI